MTNILYILGCIAASIVIAIFALPLIVIVLSLIIFAIGAIIQLLILLIKGE